MIEKEKWLSHFMTSGPPFQMKTGMSIMKKLLVLCTLLAVALVSCSFLYASQSGRMIQNERQIHNQEMVKTNKQVDLFPSLFFF
jgi:hypothetical protein